MTCVRLALLLAAIVAVAGCANVPDRVVQDRPRTPIDRANGQPRWLPCMVGDALCR